MLHIWLIPALIVLALAVWLFYLAMKYVGGRGVRTEGQTVADKPPEEVPRDAATDALPDPNRLR